MTNVILFPDRMHLPSAALFPYTYAIGDCEMRKFYKKAGLPMSGKSAGAFIGIRIPYEAC